MWSWASIGVIMHCKSSRWSFFQFSIESAWRKMKLNPQPNSTVKQSSILGANLSVNNSLVRTTTWVCILIDVSWTWVYVRGHGTISFSTQQYFYIWYLSKSLIQVIWQWGKHKHIRLSLFCFILIPVHPQSRMRHGKLGIRPCFFST